MKAQEISLKRPNGLSSIGLILSILVAMFFFSVPAHGAGMVGDYEFVAQSVHPNVLVILDNSNSMDEDVDGNAVGSNASNSRSEIARQAILSIINANAGKMHFGLMAYQQSGVQKYEIHNSFYYCSYDPSTYNPSGTPTPNDPSTNTQRWPNPADPGHYIYYDQALPMYSSNDLGNAYAYSSDYNETVDPETGNLYWVYQSKTGVLDPPAGVASGGMGAYGYSSHWFNSRFVPTDEDYAAGFQYFGRQLSWVHVGPTWFSNTSPGMGYLHVPIADSTSAHITALQDKLATSQFTTDTDTPLRNAGLTPLAGTLESARHYFEGGLNAANQGGPQSTPVQYSCQRNFVVIVTDGLPSVDKTGNPNNADTLLPGVEAEVAALRSTTVTGFSDPFDIQTFVLGFALPPELGSKLDDIAVAGGTDVDGHAYLASSATELSTALQTIFREVLNRGTSYVAPVVSVDEANRTQNGDDLYIAFFKPLTGNYWRGNLKKYGLSYVARTDCSRTEKEWTVMDKTHTIAGNCDGTFKSTARSFWLPDAAQADGGEVDKGGVGGLLKEKVDQSFTNGTYYGRNIYTYNGSALVSFNTANVSNADLTVATDEDRYRIINFIYGYTYDTQSNGNPVAAREWVLGDIIHSEPKIIDYLTSTGDLAYRFVAVGANDGMLHVFLDSPETATINGKSYEAGDEIFAFVPSDLLGELKGFDDPDVHLHMVDGSCNLFRATTKTHTGVDYYDKTLVFGERRGGSSYWAIDVTDPDPSEWTIKWHIEGGTGDYTELGYSWSKPYFARIRTASDTVKEAVILSGGYDPLEDGYPEDFEDTNNDGVRESGETFSDTEGGTSGTYDKYNPGNDTMGRGIFVVDLSDGSVLFKAVYGDADNDGDGDVDVDDDVTTGINHQYLDMKYCFPADISVIPFSKSKIVMYAADIYGQIWKITYDYYRDLSHTYTDADSTKWQVKRIFTANPGSDLATGDTNIGSAALNTADAGRKMFYSPDVSYYGNSWTSKPVLYFGTGDRAHPRYAMTSNRYYVVADHNSLTDETDLLNLTCDELDEQADSNGDGTVDDSLDTTRKEELMDVLKDETICRGFYRVMDAQGACNDETENTHTGEKILSQPTVFFKNVYFTSYQPVFDDPCNPYGNAFIYALDYSWGKSVFNYHDDGNSVERNILDTYLKLENSSIPSGVRVVTRGGHAAGLISAGGAVSGVGEDQSTNIPGPPGGVSQILWETK